MIQKIKPKSKKNKRFWTRNQNFLHSKVFNNRFLYRVLLRNDKLRRKALNWCSENISAECWIAATVGCIFYFINKEDASLFLLKWEGYEE